MQQNAEKVKVSFINGAILYKHESGSRTALVPEQND